MLPHVSIMQLAFARVKESWDEAYLSNLANNDLDRVIDKVRTQLIANGFDEAMMSRWFRKPGPTRFRRGPTNRP